MIQNDIKFPHMDSKLVNPLSGSHLSRHVTHCIEDNAKLYAELTYPWSNDKKPNIHELSKFYMDMVTWVIMANYFGVVIDNPDHVQELLERAWKEVESSPDLMKSRCDDCPVKSQGRCTE